MSEIWKNNGKKKSPLKDMSRDQREAVAERHKEGSRQTKREIARGMWRQAYKKAVEDQKTRYRDRNRKKGY